MRIVLDTHALLWMLYDDPRLPKSARHHITNATEIGYSVASLWEITLKLGNKGFDFLLPDDWHETIPRELTRIGAKRLDITPGCLKELQKLPFHHRDPFDRMIISQALAENWPILTCDKKFKKYRVEVVW